MIKMAGYKEPEDFPIPIAATDPLKGDLLFGIEDPPDEMRYKGNYEEPEGDGAYTLEKDAASRGQIDRLARDLQAKVKSPHGPRFTRYIGRIQAAMQLGVSKSEMLDMFYGGRDDIDPFRVAAAGYSAEARWMDDGTVDDKYEALSKDPNDVPVEDEPPLTAEPAVPSDPLAFDIEPVVPDLDPDPSVEPIMETAAQKHVRLYVDDRDLSWMDQKTAQDAELQPNDKVETATGELGHVEAVQPDGTFTVKMDPGAPMQAVTYGREAIDDGTIKRVQEEGVVTPIPGGETYAAKGKKLRPFVQRPPLSRMT